MFNRMKIYFLIVINVSNFKLCIWKPVRIGMVAKHDLIAIVSDAKKTKIGLFSHGYFVTILAGYVAIAPISPQ
nr:hypothetical protein [Mucilaginibacter sp. FT3.2]